MAKKKIKKKRKRIAIQPLVTRAIISNSNFQQATLQQKKKYFPLHRDFRISANIIKLVAANLALCENIKEKDKETKDGSTVQVRRRNKDEGKDRRKGQT